MHEQPGVPVIEHRAEHPQIGSARAGTRGQRTGDGEHRAVDVGTEVEPVAGGCVVRVDEDQGLAVDQHAPGVDHQHPGALPRRTQPGGVVAQRAVAVDP